MPYWVYILASHKNGTLYVGVTNNLARRVWEHTHNHQQSFTSQYSVKTLVYYESFDLVDDAIVREKQLKNGTRKRKLELISQFNPDWLDLSQSINV